MHTIKLPYHDRYPFSPITERKDYSWPEGKRLAVYLGLNIEHFAFGEGMGANIGPASPQPDVLNYGWREYGNRVGAWRCLELFDQLKLPTGALINTALYDHCPELVQALVQRGDELIGQPIEQFGIGGGIAGAQVIDGFHQADSQAVLPDPVDDAAVERFVAHQCVNRCSGFV